MNKALEREWRELLVKRLGSVQAVLRRDAKAEEKLIRTATETLARYKTAEEAHDAFGYAEITEDEYRRAVELLSASPAETSRTTNALIRLAQFIGTLRGEIAMVEANEETDEEVHHANAVAQPAADERPVSPVNPDQQSSCKPLESPLHPPCDGLFLCWTSSNR